ncbi:MAG: flagellar hook-basal body protein [Oscillospiraceae bacterium]|jgi:flagellar basal body rod protein FlgG|nr:flagellar hook-basal body protein [Oscillospiraceae bacterium]
MYEQISIAATGLYMQQRRLDVIADNIANVNTVGFKSGRLDFRDAMYTAGYIPGPPYSPEENQQKGHGVLTSQITKDMSGGSIQDTGNQLDFVLKGEAFFSVLDSNNNVRYTKAGDFYSVVCTMAREPGGLELFTSQGHHVLNDEGDIIEIPTNTTTFETTADGHITFYNGQEQVGEAQLGIYTFQNQYGLSYEGDSEFAVTEASGEAREAQADEFTLIQGALEMSTVSLAQEMQLMIRSQRAFSLAARALKTGDDMEQLANGMKTA